MTKLTLAERPSTRPGAGVRLDPVGEARWRVVDASSRIIGHLEALGSRHGVRYRARRYHTASRAFRDVGEFWRAEDAIDALRYSR